MFFPSTISNIPSHTSTWLMGSARLFQSRNRSGRGTELTHDWSISQRIVSRYSLTPMLLAGGLHAGNVRAAIQKVKPFGVDANSGTRGSDGFKDAQKLRDFITEAKEAGRAVSTASM